MIGTILLIGLAAAVVGLARLFSAGIQQLVLAALECVRDGGFAMRAVGLASALFCAVLSWLLFRPAFPDLELSNDPNTIAFAIKPLRWLFVAGWGLFTAAGFFHFVYGVVLGYGRNRRLFRAILKKRIGPMSKNRSSVSVSQLS